MSRVLTSLLRSQTSHSLLPTCNYLLSITLQDPNLYERLQPNRSLHLRSRDQSFLNPIPSPTHCPPLSENQAIGMVAATQAHFTRVIVQSTNEEQESRVGVELLSLIRGLLKKIKRRVLVGDKVLVGAVDWIDKRGMIENIFERTSQITEPPVANVNRLLLLFSLAQPKLEEYPLTRFLVEAESTGIPFTLALNKCELLNEEARVAWEQKLLAWGYQPLICSVESGTGLDGFKVILKGKTSVIVGASGVGKSSLINALRKNQLVTEEDNCLARFRGTKWFEDQQVGELSERSGRGKHTTRNVSLLPLSDGGYLADTPGFNQPSLLKVTTISLAHMFPEIRKILSASAERKCSFNDCLHLGEPGCVVKGDWERYPYYLRLLDEVKNREQSELRTLGTKREKDGRSKFRNIGVRQEEHRVVLKKYKGQSWKRPRQSNIEEFDDLDDG